MPGGRSFPQIDTRPANPWHHLGVDDVLRGVGSRPAGLSSDEAQTRLARDGPNALAPPERASVVRILVAQLKSVIVALLVVAVVISVTLGDRAEALAIAAVLALNTLIGTITEVRARRAMEALLEFDTVKAWVVRDGAVRVVDAREVVQGDIVDIEAERQVPADVRLIDATDLRIDEAVLTGESAPVEKTIDALPADAMLADRRNMAFKGTMTISGRGRGVVIGTGPRTEVGRIGELVGRTQPQSAPIEKRLDVLGRRLVWLTLAVAALVTTLGIAQGTPTLLLLQTAIALAVAAVPEALPVVATITLAVGMRRMARRRALVRRLPAVETLGSTTVICTDKTRTLTSGEMTLVRVWAAGADVRLPADAALPQATVACLEAAALASRPATDTGPPVDPEDRAVIAAAVSAGVERDRLVRERPEIAVIPFSGSRRFSAAIHQDDRAMTAYVKGAPRALLDLSTTVRTAEGARPIDEATRQSLVSINDGFAADGLRVLAVAAGRVHGTVEASVRDLEFLGFVGFEDPPAPDVKETIARLKAAGLRTVMLTGDQRRTAQAIGKTLGLLEDADRVLDGRELEALNDRERAAAAAEVNAFSRITPEHKLIVVNALQARGDIVAMIGDGVNDAPALAKADVGVAMGQRGTDAAKQAASMVLLDDRFDTIASAVEEGRVIFANIRKFVFYLFSCNVAEVLVLLGAGVMALPLPLAPLQLLWLNLVTDTFPALSLAVEPADEDVMARPPRRPDDEILSAPFIRAVLMYGALITVTTLGVFLWALQSGPQHASTVAFMTLAFAQTLHLTNARSAGTVVPAKVFSNPFAIGGAALAIALQLAAASVPTLSRVLHVTPLGAVDWLVIVVASVAPAVIGHVLRGVAGRRKS